MRARGRGTLLPQVAPYPSLSHTFFSPTHRLIYIFIVLTCSQLQDLGFPHTVYLEVQPVDLKQIKSLGVARLKLCPVRWNDGASAWPSDDDDEEEEE